ncbi:MAG: hypothetical protein AAB416_04815 [Patescibacteria group bacterium]
MIGLRLEQERDTRRQELYKPSLVIVRVASTHLMVDREWYLNHCGVVIAPRLEKEYGFIPDHVIVAPSNVARITAKEITSSMSHFVNPAQDELLCDQYSDDQMSILDPLWERVIHTEDGSHLPDDMPEAVKLIEDGGHFAGNQVHRVIREHPRGTTLMIAEWNSFSFIEAIKLWNVDTSTAQPEPYRRFYPSLGVTLIKHDGAAIMKSAYVPEPLNL